MSLKAQRKKAKLSQQELGNKLGISDAAVAQWESGKTMPTAKRLIEMANLFNCTVDELLKED